MKALKTAYPISREGLIPFVEGRVRTDRTASVGPLGLSNGQEGSVSSKERRISGRNKALKVVIPGAAWSEMPGRPEGEQGVKRARTLKTQGASGWNRWVDRLLRARDR